MVNVSWNDATAFCQWLSKKQGVKYDLPTEAQWEYACRAGTASFWYCGDSDTTLQEYTWFTANSVDETHPAGQLKPNAWGLYDMHGNAWEWCADWLATEYYAQSPPSDPSGPPTGSLRVLRGGYWGHHAGRCRSAFRTQHSPDYRGHRLGFRLGLSSGGRVSGGRTGGERRPVRGRAVAAAGSNRPHQPEAQARKCGRQRGEARKHAAPRLFLACDSG